MEQQLSSSSFSQLFSECQTAHGNVNLAVASVVLSYYPNRQVYVFGGIFRDLVRGAKSNDVDVVCEQEKFNFCYDSSTGKFQDNFYQNLEKIFGPSLVKRDTVVNNKYDKADQETGEMVFTEEELKERFDQSSTIFPFTVDHVKYLLTFETYDFELDVSFVESMEHFNGFAPSCYQDSLYVSEKLEEILSIEQCAQFFLDNLKTFVDSKTVESIVSDTKQNLLEICDVTMAKRCYKVSRLLSDEGFRLKNISDETLGMHWVNMKTKVLEDYQKQLALARTNGRMATRIFYSEFMTKCKIYHQLLHESGYKQFVDGYVKPASEISSIEENQEGWNGQYSDDESDKYDEA